MMTTTNALFVYMMTTTNEIFDPLSVRDKFYFFIINNFLRIFSERNQNVFVDSAIAPLVGISIINLHCILIGGKVPEHRIVDWPRRFSPETDRVSFLKE